MNVREKLVELLKSVLPNFRNNMAYWGEKPIYEFADCLLANGVTAVVRCKDCIHSYDDLCGLCCACGPCVDCIVQPEFYCAYGKRKEDE